MKQIFKEFGKGIAAFGCGGVGIMGCYPLLPAFFAFCSTSQNASLWVLACSIMGIFWLMPLGAMIKYVFILAIIAMATRLYRWANKGCGIWEASFVAGIATIVMNLAEESFAFGDMNELLMGI